MALRVSTMPRAETTARGARMMKTSSSAFSEAVAATTGLTWAPFHQDGERAEGSLGHFLVGGQLAVGLAGLLLAEQRPDRPDRLLGHRRLGPVAGDRRRAVGGVDVRRGLGPGGDGGEQVGLVVDQPLAGLGRQLVRVGHGQGPGRAGLDAQAAEDAAVVVDLVDGRVPLPDRVAGLRGVVGPLDVDGVGRAGVGAQLAADAPLQAVRVAVELVAAVEPGRGRLLLLRVLGGVALAEHAPEGDRQPLQDLAGHHGVEPPGAVRSALSLSEEGSRNESSSRTSSTAMAPNSTWRGRLMSTTRTTAVTATQARATGISTFQPKSISRSKRSRGRVARSQTNRKMKKKTLTTNHRIGHSQGRKSGAGPSGPPRKAVVATADTVMMFRYSARKNRANFTPEYSVW